MTQQQPRQLAGTIEISVSLADEFALAGMSDDPRDWPRAVVEQLDDEQAVALSRLNYPRIITIEHRIVSARAAHCAFGIGASGFWCERVIHFSLPPAPCALAAGLPGGKPGGSVPVLRDGAAGDAPMIYRQGHFMPAQVSR
jgi:hypothetical protein